MSSALKMAYFGLAMQAENLAGELPGHVVRTPRQDGGRWASTIGAMRGMDGGGARVLRNLNPLRYLRPSIFHRINPANGRQINPTALPLLRFAVCRLPINCHTGQQRPMKKLKDSLPHQTDQLLNRHALETASLASQVRLGLAITSLAAALWTWQYASRVTTMYVFITALWTVAFFAGRLRAKNGAQDTMTLIDITLVHVSLLAFIVQGFFPYYGGGLVLFYFPILVAAAARYDSGLVLKAGAYAMLGCLVLSLYGGSPPWFKVAALALTTLVGFNAAFTPKELLNKLAQQVAEQGFAAGAEQKEYELTAQIHQLFMPPPIVDLPQVWFSSKHGAGTETVGDYYHIFNTPRGPLLIVGDLPGRGVEALGHVARIHQQLLLVVNRDPALPKIAAALNTIVYELYGGKRPFTCVLAEWEGEEMRYLNAGHLPIIQRTKQEQLQLPVNNAPLGVSPDATFSESIVPCAARDLLLFFTDGLYSKVTSDREQGIAEVARLAEEFTGAEVTTLCHRIFDCAQPGYDALKDDATMVVIRRQPAAVAAAADNKAG